MRKARCMMGSGMHPDLRGGKGTKEQSGLDDVRGLGESHLGRTNNNCSDQVISENDFKNV